MMGKAPMMGKKGLTPKVKVVDPSENTVEANLGRKRCISFACGRKTDDQNEPKTPVSPSGSQTFPPKAQAPKQEPEEAAIQPLKRKTTLTFVCPGRETAAPRERSLGRKTSLRPRCRGSPAPALRKSSPDLKDTTKNLAQEVVASASTDRKGIPTSGLGKFEESEATRFHEFASSMDEDDEWVSKELDYLEKITLNDCMKKEMAIRRLGEQAEQEALEEEEYDVEDLADDDSTVHDFSSDDGNESDNEAGFAESDDSDNEGSDYEFWAPSLAIPEAPTEPISARPTMERRVSNTSFDSMTDDHNSWLPAPLKMGYRRPLKISQSIKIRPRTPQLPDSTDFVCGTLDEDRPLEAAYKSCLEQRRLLKQVPIPQDIDPSFPTSDPEDNEDLEPSEEELSESDSEPTRGRTEGDARKPSPRHSPKRLMSPPPRRAGRTSPKRLKSPPPRMRAKSPPPHVRAKSPIPAKWEFTEEMHLVKSPEGLNISHLVQRRPLVRTKSLPRTPNPFFTGLDKDHRWKSIPALSESPEREHSRTRELHTRGPVDIVEGLEKKRQKRKEKFWRQHCRKAAKEQLGKRPVPGHGAERMKELGLEVAERCRAYGVGQDTQLVLSV
jgi:hypothetical protein